MEKYTKYQTLLTSMTTSVKMSEETKSRLEELQAIVKLETGRKVSQQEVLDRLVRRGYDSREDFVASFEEPTLPLSEEERERFHAGTFASDEPIDEEDIDRILYDEEQL